MKTASQSLCVWVSVRVMCVCLLIIVFFPCLCWHVAATPSTCESSAEQQDRGSSTVSWCCTPPQDSRLDSPSCIHSPLEAQRLLMAIKWKKKRVKAQSVPPQHCCMWSTFSYIRGKWMTFFRYFYLLFLGKALGQMSKSPKAKYRSSKRLIWWKISED